MSPFIVEAEGPAGTFGVFEDDGETGYLYIYKPDGSGITRHLHLYDRSATVAPQEADIRVAWSADRTKCGVFIWDRMRGIIDLAKNREGRVWIEDRATPGIGDPEWLEGF